MTTKEARSNASDGYFSASMFESLISGAVFGVALTATGMYQPAVIRSQMVFENWHMVQTFLTASGASTLLVTLCQKLGYIDMKPRNFASLGLLGPFDGNIIGGALLGIGMTLSGSCPGTLFAQIGTGVPSSLYTLSGAVLGSIIWSLFLRAAVDSLRSRNQHAPEKAEDRGIDGLLGISPVFAAAGIATMFAAIVAIVSALGLAKPTGLVGPLIGGLLIAGSQLFSIIARKTLLGTSMSFEELGDCIGWALRGGGGECKPKSYKSMSVVTGIMVGALGLSFAAPLPQAPSVEIETTKLTLGGVLLVLGSMIGGGCTSGHGISGISLLSVSSFVTVVAIFAGAIATALLL